MGLAWTALKCWEFSCGNTALKEVYYLTFHMIQCVSYKLCLKKRYFVIILRTFDTWYCDKHVLFILMNLMTPSLWLWFLAVGQASATGSWFMLVPALEGSWIFTGFWVVRIRSIRSYKIILICQGVTSSSDSCNRRTGWPAMVLFLSFIWLFPLFLLYNKCNKRQLTCLILESTVISENPQQCINLLWSSPLSD